MVLSAKADQGRLDIAKLPGFPIACQGLPGQRLEDLHSDGLLNPTNVGLGLLGPEDAFSHFDQIPFI